jgi:hypothetical protein
MATAVKVNVKIGPAEPLEIALRVAGAAQYVEGVRGLRASGQSEREQRKVERRLLLFVLRRGGQEPIEPEVDGKLAIVIGPVLRRR